MGGGQWSVSTQAVFLCKAGGKNLIPRGVGDNRVMCCPVYFN